MISLSDFQVRSVRSVRSEESVRLRSEESAVSLIVALLHFANRAFLDLL